MSESLKVLWTALSELLPKLLGAVLVLLVAYLAARLLQRLSTQVLQRLGFDVALERTGAVSSLRRVGFEREPSLVIGYVVFWTILLAGVAAALSALGLSSLQVNVDLIVVLAGKALVAALIMAGGLAVAGWLSSLAARRAEEAGLRGGASFRQVVFIGVLAVSALLAAAQIGIDVSLLVLLAAVFLGTAGLVVALALGVGLAPLSGNIAAGRYVKGNDIRTGDEISVNGLAGIVEQLGYASVTLRSEDGRLHYIPNRVLLEEVVTKRPYRD